MNRILLLSAALLLAACTTPGDNAGSRSIGAIIGGALVAGIAGAL